MCIIPQRATSIHWGRRNEKQIYFSEYVYLDMDG